MQLPQESLDTLFNHARTANDFLDKPVSTELLQQVYDLAKMGPTAFNSQPARYVFVTSAPAKTRLVACMSAANADKTMKAPVNVIVAIDTRFFDHLPTVFPHYPAARDLYADNAQLASSAATLSGTLGGAYFIVAARALGLDCGPMTGFDPAGVNATFFADGRYRASFIINLGYRSTAALHPRSPRLRFDEACQIL